MPQPVKIALGKSWKKFYEGPLHLGSTLGRMAEHTGWAKIQIQAEKRLIPKSLQHLDVIVTQRPKLLSRKGAAT
jgi:hypothetical protein